MCSHQDSYATFLFRYGICSRAAALCLVCWPRRSQQLIVVGLAWPAIFCPVTISGPASTSPPTKVWRKSWGEKYFTPASLGCCLFPLPRITSLLSSLYIMIYRGLNQGLPTRRNVDLSHSREILAASRIPNGVGGNVKQSNQLAGGQGTAAG